MKKELEEVSDDLLEMVSGGTSLTGRQCAQGQKYCMMSRKCVDASASC